MDKPSTNWCRISSIHSIEKIGFVPHATNQVFEPKRKLENLVHVEKNMKKPCYLWYFYVYLHSNLEATKGAVVGLGSCPGTK